MADLEQSAANVESTDIFGDAKKNWGWLVGLGVVFVILGVIGLGMSVTLTLAGVMVFGWLLIIGGLLQIAETFQVSGWKSVMWHLVMAVMYILAGGVILYDPAGSAIAITLFIGIALIITGVTRIFIAFQLNPARAWWLVLVSGLISILIGIMVMAKWPLSSFWVIGAFIAVEMILNGWSYIMMGLAAKDAKEAEGI